MSWRSICPAEWAESTPLDLAVCRPNSSGMSRITDFHAHIYFDPDEVDRAKAFAAAAQENSECPSGISIWLRSVRIRAAVAS
jgi:hypothetical protein